MNTKEICPNCEKEVPVTWHRVGTLEPARYMHMIAPGEEEWCSGKDSSEKSKMENDSP